MKINELSQPDQLDEGIGDAIGGVSRALVGDYATSSIKGMFTGRGKEQLTYDLFFKDFYQDALASLTNGIQSGIIDPGIQSPASPVSPATSQTGAAKTQAPGDTAQPGPAGGGQKPGADPINQAYGRVVGAMRNVQSGTKPLPKTMIDSITKDIQNGRFNKDWAIQTGSKIVSLAQKGYDVSELKKSWDSVTAIGRKQGTVQENVFSRLDAIFESIIREQETGGAKSISEYMLDWFTAYMGGTNWGSYKPSIMKLVKNIEDTYASDKGKAGIKQLAKAAYAIPGAGSAKGTENIKGKKPEPGAAKTTGDFGAGGYNAAPAGDEVSKQVSTLAQNPAAAAAMKSWAAKNP